MSRSDRGHDRRSLNSNIAVYGCISGIFDTFLRMFLLFVFVFVTLQEARVVVLKLFRCAFGAFPPFE